MTTAKMPMALACVAIAAGTLVGCSSDTTPDRSANGATTTSVRSATATGQAASSVIEGTGPTRVPALVKQIEPSVVAVRVTSPAGVSSEGSGVIVRRDGVIVTNNHVVQSAGEVFVVFADGTRAPARVEATDPFSDLAILRVDRDGLPAVELATGYPQVGELAVAVGNPLGFENTVTAGIISGLARSIPAAAAQGGQSLVDLIQTDAAISPGNSGGALVGHDGRVVGINVAYIPPAVGAVSLGFAIPAPTVSDVVEELLRDGTADHAYLGVSLATVTEQIASELGVNTDAGALVTVVAAGSPAAEAGLRRGDVIVGIDGEPVTGIGALLTRMRRYDPGDRADLTVVRAGDRAEVTVELATRPPD